jgi:hypothetical protein
VILNAQRECNLTRRLVIATEHRAHTLTIMVHGVLNRLNVERQPPALGDLIELKVLKVGGFLAQVIEFERLLCAWIIKAATAYEDIENKPRKNMLSVRVTKR